MRFAVAAVVNNFVDTGLADDIAGAMPLAIGPPPAVSWIFETPGLQLEREVSLRQATMRSKLKSHDSHAYG
jgi:hypothetical protein